MNEEIISIQTVPKNTGNPIKDFENEILSQEEYVLLNKFYKFGLVFVKFYVFRGKIGMDYFKPIENRKNTFNAIRISTTGERKNLGRVDLPFDF